MKGEIEITSETFVINQIPILKSSDIEALPSSKKRVRELDNGSKLILLDDIGIRYWIHTDNTFEVQLCLNEKKSEVFPYNDFSDTLFLNDIPFNKETQINEDIIKELGLMPDDDNLRFKITTYLLPADHFSYAVTINDDSRIRHISISLR